MEPFSNYVGGLLKIPTGITNAIGAAFGIYNTIMGLMGISQGSTTASATTAIDIEGS